MPDVPRIPQRARNTGIRHFLALRHEVICHCRKLPNRVSSEGPSIGALVLTKDGPMPIPQIYFKVILNILQSDS